MFFKHCASPVARGKKIYILFAKTKLFGLAMLQFFIPWAHAMSWSPVIRARNRMLHWQLTLAITWPQSVKAQDKETLVAAQLNGMVSCLDDQWIPSLSSSKNYLFTIRIKSSENNSDASVNCLQRVSVVWFSRRLSANQPCLVQASVIEENHWKT